MSRRRNRASPKIQLPIWKQDGKLWYAEKADLEAIVGSSGHSEDHLKRKLGAGFNELKEAMNGKRLEGWTVHHIEWGLAPDAPAAPNSHSWPPPPSK